MRIALAQISSGTDPDANLALVADGVARAAAAGADLAVFPEATMCRFGIPLGPVAQPLDGPWATGIQALADRHGITVVAGMFTPAADGRVHNTIVIAGPGRPLMSYNKIHLFDAFDFAESTTVAPGSDPLTVDIAGTAVGVTTCYDIRFAQLFTVLAERGAAVSIVAASWGDGEGKLRQWRSLATARALDTAGYVVAVGQARPTDPAAQRSAAPTGIGHSMVVDPYGATLFEAGNDVEFAVIDIDPAIVDTARDRLGVLRNRRPDLH
ncbi:carbon-nitrogen hydrolase family protein [Jongsikchunia kroppenstedtii]|uniref:carbon-nitrogen hydrolase family protein n=1 Tax=Jongsikchunia kroppenstedtii TaxID=1121721 RepID=UPI000365EE7D|nr:carbon-nitrogen hydrolase family protein [Jongsikchunia kroppenstedtii]